MSPSLLNFQKIILTGDVVVENRLYWFVILLHYLFPFELLVYFIQTLHVCVDNLTHLLWIAIWTSFRPLEEVKLQIKVKHKQRMGHVDKCKANRLPRLEINWQIYVIVLEPEIFVDNSQKVLLCKLHGHILNHESRPLHHFEVAIQLSFKNPIQIHSVYLRTILLMSFFCWYFWLRFFRRWSENCVRISLLEARLLSLNLCLHHLLHLLVKQQLLMLECQVLRLDLVEVWVKIRWCRAKCLNSGRRRLNEIRLRSWHLQSIVLSLCGRNQKVVILCLSLFGQKHVVYIHGWHDTLLGVFFFVIFLGE